MQKKLFKLPGSAFGGLLSRGKRKERRPLATKRPMHVTLRSSRAKGTMSLRTVKNLKFAARLLAKETKRRKLRVYNYSINSNHIHLLIQGKTRADIQNFLRVFSGQMAQFITDAWKGAKLAGRFWDDLVWTRIVEWGKGYRTAKSYVWQNDMESMGLIPYFRSRQTSVSQLKIKGFS